MDKADAPLESPAFLSRMAMRNRTRRYGSK